MTCGEFSSSVTPDAIEWNPVFEGVEIAVISGDPNKAGSIHKISEIDHFLNKERDRYERINSQASSLLGSPHSTGSLCSFRKHGSTTRGSSGNADSGTGNVTAS